LRHRRRLIGRPAVRTARRAAAAAGRSRRWESPAKIPRRNGCATGVGITPLGFLPSAVGPNGTWYSHNIYMNPNSPERAYHEATYGPLEKFGYK
jgi:hypothetical protein